MSDQKPPLAADTLDGFVRRLPRVPMTRADLDAARTSWWWFCENETMKCYQPVFVTEDDKYHSDSPCRFMHPWGSCSERWKADSNRPATTDSDIRYVSGWADSFRGPCLHPMIAGVELYDPPNNAVTRSEASAHE